jgi:hypothetical protein
MLQHVLGAVQVRHIADIFSCCTRSRTNTQFRGEYCPDRDGLPVVAGFAGSPLAPGRADTVTAHNNRHRRKAVLGAMQQAQPTPLADGQSGVNLCDNVANDVVSLTIPVTRSDRAVEGTACTISR